MEIGERDTRRKLKEARRISLVQSLESGQTFMAQVGQKFPLCLGSLVFC